MGESANDDGSDEAANVDDLAGVVITVDELNGKIQKHIEEVEFGVDYIVGDVTDARLANSGHYHFDIVEDGASLHCVKFNAEGSDIEEIEEEDRVAVSGRINYYEGQGSMSVIIHSVELIGESLYQKKLRKRRKRLAKEGLFDPEVKQELPEFPERIGIVTADNSDAETDVINSIQQTDSTVDVEVYDVKIQGEGAAGNVVQALEKFEGSDVDVVVVTRGGGSENDLKTFNTEKVVRGIYESSTPIVTAIGHENDRMLADLAADERAMTPTDVGTVVVPDMEQWADRITTVRKSLGSTYSSFVDRRLKAERSKVRAGYGSFIDLSISEEYSALRSAYKNLVSTHINTYRSELDASIDKLEQQKEHETETEELQRNVQRYKKAAIILALLLIGAFILLFIF